MNPASKFALGKLPGLFALFCFLFCCLPTGCDSREKQPLRIALSPWPGYEFFFLAAKKGFFEEEGVQVELVRSDSPGDSRRAFERRHVDACGLTYFELLLTRLNTRIDCRTFYAVNTSDGADVVLGFNSIAQIADLRGKRIGIETESVNTSLLCFALQKTGLNLRDVELVEMYQSSMPRAMQEKDVSAIVSFPPFSTEILTLPDTHILFDSSQAPGLIADVIVADRETLETRLNEFTKIIRAVGRAIEYWKQNPESANVILAEGCGLSPDDFVREMRGIRLLGMESQALFFNPGGWADKSFEANRRILREVDNIEIPGSYEQTVFLAPIRLATRTPLRPSAP